MALARFEPFTAMDRFRSAFDTLFDQALRSMQLSIGASPLPLDVYETPDEVIVRAPVPGADPKDVHVTCERGMLTIQAHLGEDYPAEEAKGWRWHCRESWSGEVTRTFTLPASCDPDGAQAFFQNGILRLRFPKTEAAKPRTIPIAAGQIESGAAPQLAGGSES